MPPVELQWQSFGGGVPQLTPHAPQFSALSGRVSQPLALFESQSRYGLPPGSKAAHAVYEQAPADVHTALVTFCGLHTLWQVPQFDVLNGVSQPLALFESQSRKPGLHVVSLQLPLPSQADALALAVVHAAPAAAALLVQPLAGLHDAV